MPSLQDTPAHVTPVRITGRSVTLAQLMLWMFSTCLVLAQDRWYLASGETLDVTESWYFNLHALIYSPLQGAGVAGLLLCLWRRLFGGPAFPVQPGHWFLVILGAHLAFAAALQLVEAWIGPQEVFEQMPAWFHRSQLLADVVLRIGLPIAAAVYFWRERLWRMAFLAMIPSPLSGLLHSSLFMAFNSRQWILNELAWSIAFRVLYALPAAFAVVAANGGRRRAGQRDFLHWTGIATTVLLAGIEWPFFIVWRYLFR